MATIAERITAEVMALPGITAEPHRFGGVEFRLNGREIGHLHGSRMADLPFPKKVRDSLIAEGKAEPHHLLADTGWVSFYIHGEDDIPKVVALFERNHQIIAERRANRGKA